MEIKVKAWDSERKTMFTDPKWVEFYFVKGKLKAKNFNRKGNEQELKVIQYTGLKDKNGKEIYEGDLIKNERGRTGKVVWHDYAGCWDTRFMSDEAVGTEVDRAWGFKNNMWPRCVEVIGNIYESPGLIEIATD